MGYEEYLPSLMIKIVAILVTLLVLVAIIKPDALDFLVKVLVSSLLAYVPFTKIFINILNQ